MKRHVLWIATALLCAGTFVQAEEPAATEKPKRPTPPAAEDAFKKADTNNDGQISMEEYKAVMAERAKNRPNGKEMPADMIEKRFKSMDTDNSGAISLEEFKKGREMRGPQNHGEGAPKAPEAKPAAPDAAPKAPEAK